MILKTELTLSESERDQIATILSRRANEIAGYKGDHSCEYGTTAASEKQMPASVEYALELEIKRLRRLADKLTTKKPEPDE